MVVGYPAGRYPGVGHLGVAYHWSQAPWGGRVHREVG